MANRKFYFTDANKEAVDFGLGHPTRKVKTSHGYAHLVDAPDEQTAYEYLAQYCGLSLPLETFSMTVERIREQFDVHEYSQ